MVNFWSYFFKEFAIDCYELNNSFSWNHNKIWKLTESSWVNWIVVFKKNVDSLRNLILIESHFSQNEFNSHSFFFYFLIKLLLKL